MSTQMEPVRVGAGRPTQQSDNARRLAMASEVRWVIQFFKDISFMEPTGRGIKNSIEPEPPDEQGNVFCGMRRGQPYPVVNHEYNVLPHEQEGNDLPPAYGGEAPGARVEPQPIKAPKYALDCANELVWKYGAEYGLVVLEPLTGMMDESLVQLVFQVVQPYAYKIHELEYELTEGAKDRIAGAQLPKNVERMAEQCRLVMLRGYQRAANTMREHYGTFDRDTKSYVGSKQGRHTAIDYDYFISDQLGLPVPAMPQAIPQQAQQQMENPKYLELLERLTDSATQKDTGAMAMAERLATIEAEREAEREANAQLAAQVQELLAAKEVKPKKEKAA